MSGPCSMDESRRFRHVLNFPCLRSTGKAFGAKEEAMNKYFATFVFRQNTVFTSGVTSPKIGGEPRCMILGE